MSKILVAQGIVAEALIHARQAAQIKPDWSDAWMMISGLAGMLDDHDISEHAARMTVQLDPSDSGGLINLGHALADRHDLRGAIACYQAALRLNPSLERVRYRLQSLGANAAPERAPDQYISGLFDAYAKTFDEHLTQQLDYQSPAHIMKALNPYIKPDIGELDILDLGCGTGLCGQVLRPASRKLVGVDLSSGMLQEAWKKALYDELWEREAVAYLCECGQSFDVITAADLLVYIGDLSELFSAAHAALRNSGMLVVSVEVTDGASPYELHVTGRYRHTLKYVQTQCKSSGFDILVADKVVHRRESRAPVEGFVVVLKKC